MRYEKVFEGSPPSPLGRLAGAAMITDNYGVQGRTLDCYALIYILRGSCQLEINHLKPRTVEAGSAFLLVPGKAHTYHPPEGEDPWDEVFLLFEGDVFDLWARANHLPPEDPVFSLSPAEVWANRFFRIWDPPSSPLRQICNIQRLLADLIEASGETSTSEQVWVEHARELLQQNAGKPDAVQSAARKLGLSYDRFRKVFRERDGQTPGVCLREYIVMQSAQRLLAESTPIKQIAEDMGFCDEYYFSRQFKKIMGLPPAAYRKRWVRET